MKWPSRNSCKLPGNRTTRRRTNSSDWSTRGLVNSPKCCIYSLQSYLGQITLFIRGQYTTGLHYG